MTEPEPTFQQSIRMRPALRSRLTAYCLRHGGMSLNAAMIAFIESGLAADENQPRKEATHGR